MTEKLDFHFSLSCIGEGNGNPLQCSCLENPRDREPGGLPSMGSHRVGYDWSDLAAAAKSFEFFWWRVVIRRQDMGAHRISVLIAIGVLLPDPFSEKNWWISVEHTHTHTHTPTLICISVSTNIHWKPQVHTDIFNSKPTPHNFFSFLPFNNGNYLFQK